MSSRFRTFGLAVTNVGDQVATIVPTDGSVRLDDGTSTCVLGDVGGADTVWGGLRLTTQLLRFCQTNRHLTIGSVRKS